MEKYNRQKLCINLYFGKLLLLLITVGSCQTGFAEGTASQGSISAPAIGVAGLGVSAITDPTLAAHYTRMLRYVGSRLSVVTTGDGPTTEAGAVADTTPPDTTILLNPTNPSTSTSATFSFTGSDDVTPSGSLTFEVKLDNGVFTAATSPRVFTGLSSGTHTFQVRAVDATGNVDPTPASYTWVVDNTPPDTTITANPLNPSNSANASFSFIGNDAGGSGVTGFQVQLDGGGFSSATSPQVYSGLSDGSHTFQVRAIDLIGNIDPTPSSYTWLVDTTPPNTTLTATPPNPSGSANASFSFIGNDAGGSGVTGFQVQLDGGGFSSATSPQVYSGLSDGSHTFQVRAVDLIGNIDPTPSSYTWIVDTTPPAAPVVITPANGSVANNNQPVVTGTAEANSTITVFVDGTSVGTTTADASGNWSFILSAALSDGSHTAKARSSDATGNTSVDSNTNTFTIDTTPPNATLTATPPNPSNAANASFSFTGNDGSGSGVAGFEVNLDGGGYSSATSPKVYTGLSDGSHTFRVRAVDNAGNVNPTPASYTWIVDTTPPPAPVVITPANGSVANNNQPVVTGTAEANSTVTVFVDGTSVGTTTADASGNWSFTVGSALSDGSHTAKARSSDAAGNTSVDSNTNTFTIDTTPPAAPVVITPANGVATGNTKPVVSGTAEANSTITVFVDGTSVGTTTADGSGNWSFTVSSALSEGSHTTKARATDAASNTSVDSNTNTFTIDTTPPAAPVVITPANGVATGNTKPVVSGTAEANSTVMVLMDGTSVGTTTADGSGNWSFTVSSALSEGSHTTKARASDAAGNASVDSNTNTFTIDTTPPAAPVVITPANGGATGNTKPVVSGTAEANSTITVFVDGTSVGTTTADASGNWSFTVSSALSEGSHTTKARATDAASNTSVDSNTNTFTIDTTPPAAPVVITPANGSVANNTKPVVTGTAEANSTVMVLMDGTSVGTTTADGSGNWSFTVSSALSEGSHTTKARATDAASNTSVDSNTNTFTIDTTPPATPVVSTPANGAVLSNNQPIISGTAEASSTVTVNVDGTEIAVAIANASGNWSLTINSAFPEGVHTVKARATDAVGNSGVESSTNTFTVNTAPSITGFAPTAALVCEGAPVTLTATVGNVTGSYAYTLTNGSSPVSGTSAAATFSQTLNGVSPGNYTYALTVSSNKLNATAETQVVVGNPSAVNNVSPGGVLGNGICSVDLTCSGTGSSFIVTGPNGFVYSTVYRQAGSYTVRIPNVTTPGIYTLTVYSGACSTKQQTVVSGTACK